jgi:aquaporin Z
LILPYLSNQLSGACLTIFILSILFPHANDLGTTLPSVNWQNAFIAEFIFSFLLMFVILNVTSRHMKKGVMAEVTIGATIGILALIGGPVTGASMNPARSIAPAIFSLKFKYLWLYILAPITGTVLAASISKIIIEQKK